MMPRKSSRRRSLAWIPGTMLAADSKRAEPAANPTAIRPNRHPCRTSTGRGQTPAEPDESESLHGSAAACARRPSRTTISRSA